MLFPEDLSTLDGPSVLGQAEIISSCDERGVGRVTSLERRLSWLDDYERFVFQELPDGKRKAIRKATPEDIRSFRVPIWIQDEEIPMCCGQEMVFVGQLDDQNICTEAPPDAKYWWHDVASFYVFTCPQCLECAAIGQQY